MRKDLEQHRLRAAVRGPGSADGRADRDLVAVNEDVLGDDADAGKPGGELASGVLSRCEPGGAERMAEENGNEQVAGLVELPGAEVLLHRWTRPLASSRAVIGVTSSWLVGRVKTSGAGT
jgi:hypothetical protein